MKINIEKYEFEVENDISFWNIIDNWEKHSFEILKKYLNDNKIFIDVGAWNGVLSMYASKIAKKVYCFEPDKIAFEHLSNNIKLNNIKNINCINKGASLKNGISKFYVRYFGDSVSSLLDRDMENYKTNETVEIKTIKLSEFLIENQLKNIGLIKMDTEGSEIYILDDMEKYIEKYKPNMYISFHPNWFPDKDYNINKIANLMDKSYDIFTIFFKKINKDDFIKNLYSSNHSFLFLKKQTIK